MEEGNATEVARDVGLVRAVEGGGIWVLSGAVRRDLDPEAGVAAAESPKILLISDNSKTQIYILTKQPSICPRVVWTYASS